MAPNLGCKGEAEEVKSRGLLFSNRRLGTENFALDT